MKRLLPALLLATAAATASATASAQHVGWTEIPRPPLPPGPGLAYLSVIADDIGLTEAQEAEINELVDASRLESAVDRERQSQLPGQPRRQQHETRGVETRHRANIACARVERLFTVGRERPGGGHREG